jgi:hypothetical protein
MSLTLAERIRLVEDASAKSTIERLKEADAKLDDSIEWVMCDCPECRIRRTWMSHQPKPAVSRKLLRNLGLVLLAVGVILLFGLAIS